MAGGRPRSATVPLARSARTSLSLATRAAPSAAAGAMARTLLAHLDGDQSAAGRQNETAAPSATTVSAATPSPSAG